MRHGDSTEINAPPPCPLLPAAPPGMSWRNLRTAAAAGPPVLFEESLRYAQFLWLRGLPARAILALCRALYLDPAGLAGAAPQPYAAYVWLLRHYNGTGFLGNPRVSFLHQAARVPPSQPLKRARAWAMWHLTTAVRGDLPTDPGVPEHPPSCGDLAAYLDANGLPGEGRCFTEALAVARR